MEVVEELKLLIANRKLCSGPKDEGIFILSYRKTVTKKILCKAPKVDTS